MCKFGIFSWLLHVPSDNVNSLNIWLDPNSISCRILSPTLVLLQHFLNGLVFHFKFVCKGFLIFFFN